jgi:hypothetical protein
MATSPGEPQAVPQHAQMEALNTALKGYFTVGPVV